MSPVVSPLLLAAAAIDAVGDPHLRPGLHVRALPSPDLGLPATPLVVSRAAIMPTTLEQLASTSDVIWVDATQTVRQVPFDVTPDNPVTAHFTSGECVWAQLLTASTATLVGRTPTGSLAFEALVNGAGEHAVVGRRTAAPWTLAGARLDAVRVSGTGRVTGLRWISRSRVTETAPRAWRTWSLPLTAPTTRYRPTAAAPSEADVRVSAGAAVRRPLYAVGAYDVNAPLDAPLQPVADVVTRVAAAKPDLLAWLQQVMTDLSAPQRKLRRSYVHAPPAPVGQKAPEPTTLGIGLESQILTSAVDPDLGRWLGFADVDAAPAEPAGSLIVYHVRGLWRYDAARWANDLWALPVDFHLRLSRTDALLAFPELGTQNIAPSDDGPFLDITALAPAIVGAPPAPLAAPELVQLEDMGWQPVPVPAARRAVRVRARGLTAPAQVALTASDPAGLRLLNPLAGGARHTLPGAPSERPLPLVVSRPRVDGENGRGWLDDRDGHGGEVVYRLAQSDWFGRWSGWGTGKIGPKQRAAPMAPVIEAHYAAPTEFTPPDADKAGVLTLRVPVPRLEDLPPGGFPLEALEVTCTVDGGVAQTTAHLLSKPTASGAKLTAPDTLQKRSLVIELDHVKIPPAGERKVHVVARWRDAGTPVKRLSAPSVPVVRTLRDPRPPALPKMPATLRYSARPDAMGRARVELSWPAAANTRYRVFASTDATLVEALRLAGQTNAANAIADAPDLVARAQALQAHAALFTWDAFEHLTTEAIEASGDTARYVHHLSGGLAGLACYRVLPQGPSGAMPDIATAPLIPVAVPNLGPPPQPLASLVHGSAATEDGPPPPPTVRVVVPATRVQPTAWRLRRASVGGAPPARMLVVAHGTIAADAVQPDDTTRFDIVDTATLRPWRRYHYVVEVQAPPAPNAVVPLPGEWSAASAPVPFLNIPPTPPEPPSQVTAALVDGVGVRLTIAHADPNLLVPTALGRFAIEVVRSIPNAPASRRALAVTRTAQGAYEAIDDVLPAAGVPTKWAVRITDPLGRTSATTVSNSL